MTELFNAEIMAQTITPEVRRRDWFIIFAQLKNQYWVLQPSPTTAYSELDAARKAAEELSGNWTHRIIVKIPGNGVAEK